MPRHGRKIRYNEGVILQSVMFSLASLLLGAHFLRGGNLLPVLICIAAPFLLLHRKRWVLIALQAFAYFAAAIWIYTAIDLVNKRLLAGEPFRGVIIILGSVTLFTAAAGLLMNLRGMKDRFPTEP